MGLVKKKKKVAKKKLTRRPAKKSGKPKSKHVYETKIDEILKIVQNQEKITLEDLSIDVDLSTEKTESWLKILQKNKLVLIHYPLFGKPFATKANHTKLPKEKAQDNKTRNLVIFAIISFIVLIILYYFFTK